MVHSVGRRRCSRDLCEILLWMNRNRLFVGIAISVRDQKSSQSCFWISSKKSDGGFNWLTVLRKILVLTFQKIVDGGSRNCKQLTRELKQIRGISVAVGLGTVAWGRQCFPKKYLMCTLPLFMRRNILLTARRWYMVMSSCCLRWIIYSWVLNWNTSRTAI